MAKRKRLSPAAITPELDTIPHDLETKSMPTYPLGVHPPVPTNRAPIAQVAGDASSQAALEEVSAELHAARVEGRLVQRLPLDAIRDDHLVRDRLVLDEDEMEVLKSSLIARGQQTPIEVVQRSDETYGLISGWRRLNSIKALRADTGKDEFATIQALVKPIDDVSDSYVAMVEENEVRANLSFYERARLAAEAAKLGVYPNPQRAVQALFASAHKVKRSKIMSFLAVYEAFDGHLRFPAAIPEKLGLGLAGALDKHSSFARQIKDVLRKAESQTALDERKLLERALARAGQVGKHKDKQVVAQDVAPGVKLEARQGRLVLSGKGVTDDLRIDLLGWLSKR